jgi:hypothetical protein
MDKLNPNKSGYGKLPLWQLIAIYVVVGLIVYGLVYYLVFVNKGGYGLYSHKMSFRNLNCLRELLRNSARAVYCNFGF